MTEQIFACSVDKKNLIKTAQIDYEKSFFSGRKRES